MAIIVICDQCNGTGKIESKFPFAFPKKCPACSGNGEIKKTYTN